MPPPSRPVIDVSQAFVDEMVDIAKAEWLKEYYTTGDKKGLIAKVGAAYICTFDEVGQVKVAPRLDSSARYSCDVVLGCSTH